MKKLVMVISILSAALLVMAAGNLPSKEDEINKKAEELLAKMTLEEKIGQMTQVDMLALQDDADIAKYYLGSLLSGGNSDPADITPEGWLNSYNKYQAYTQQTRLKIPLIYGIDAVHGHNNVKGAVIFPHNIGLGATRNPELVEKANRAIAEEISATGMNWTFAPCIAVARDERWGRTYESFGETPELAESLGAASVRGLQGKDLSNPTSVLACAKHFLADGGTTGGDDQGNAEFDEATLRKIHLPGYIAAIKENAATVMVSYSSFNGTKMHGNKYLVTDVLKNELGFKGIVVSDWAAIDQLEGDFKSDVEISINAGLDMIMIPFGKENENSYQKFFQYLKELVEEGKVPMSRIDDAVLRILKVKFEMNLFERPLLTSKDNLASVGSKEHREIAREGVRQSLVLLKNNNKVLPAAKDKKIFVAGEKADNIGAQCGGWTIAWQGQSGQVTTGGTTILQAVKNTAQNVRYSAEGTGAEGSDVAIVVVGEMPYAEMFGDNQELTLSPEDLKTIENVKASGVPMVVVLLSGRPMIIENTLNQSDAFVAAWLPGTEGQGVADVLFGDYKPTGKLPHTWPKNISQLPINQGDANYAPLFEYGFGLTY